MSSIAPEAASASRSASASRMFCQACGSEAVAVAARLRARGISTEVAPKADRFGKQIRYADRRGIPFVWFGAGEVKDIRSGEQVAADPDSWTPPEDDLRPSVRGGVYGAIRPSGRAHQQRGHPRQMARGNQAGV